MFYYYDLDGNDKNEYDKRVIKLMHKVIVIMNLNQKDCFSGSPFNYILFLNLTLQSPVFLSV